MSTFSKNQKSLVTRLYKIILLVCLMTVSFSSAITAQDILVTKDTTVLRLEPSVEVYTDIEGKLTFDQILKDKDSSAPSFVFTKNNKKSLDFGFSKSTYWLKFTLTAGDHIVDDNYYLEVGYPFLDHVDLFMPDQSGQYQHVKTGDYYPFDERKIHNRNIVFPVHLEAVSGKEFFMRVQSSGTVNIPLSLSTPVSFIKNTVNDMYMYGFYYGIMLVIALYNFFLFLSTREKEYLFYVGYVTFMALFQNVLNGLAFMYLWKNNVWIAHTSAGFTLSLAVIFSMLFAKYFLQITKSKYPILNYVVQGVIAIGAVTLVSSLFLSHHTMAYFMVLIGLLFSVTAFLAGTMSLIKKYRPARFFMLAFSSFIFFCIVHVLGRLQILPFSFITEHGIQVGSAIEVIVLSLALADKINILKQENERHQQEALEMQIRLTESYARFVPKELMVNLGKEYIYDLNLGDQVQKKMTIMFVDIRNFTQISEQMTPEENFNFINSYLNRMTPLIKSHNGFIDKFMGDGIMALFGDNPTDSIRAAINMQKILSEYNENRISRGYPPIMIGIGIHSGSLMMGIIGSDERMEGTVISDAVNVASRIEGATKAYKAKIAISENTISALEDQKLFHFRFLDRVAMKGKTREIAIYEVLEGEEPETFEAKLKTLEEYNRGIENYYANRFEKAEEHFKLVIKEHSDDYVAQLYLHRIVEMTGNKTA